MCPVMVVVPGGTFLMGAGDSETKGFIEEVPQHPVHIKSFALRDGSAFQADRPIAEMTGNLASMNGTTTCSYRMLRGGDWGGPERAVRGTVKLAF
ncbi:MAG TPA: hypothetical protein VM865_00365 [Acidobacteriaceae bacterium]|jgi:formylglycine-generating enzyme required for sulfatase activity|nr:hypothetical protein [Acidobacteriaceae bacterium]